jgi:CRP/FNR family transcriptional regulator
MQALVNAVNGAPVLEPRVGSPRQVLRDVSSPRTSCTSCNLLGSCVSAGYEPEHKRAIEELVAKRVRLRKGDTLFRPGEKFATLYAVRLGSFKTVLLAQDGRDQVSGFHMAGDVIGTDGIGSGLHECQAIALEDTEVCVMPYSRIEELERASAQVLRNMHRMLAAEIARERGVMLMLGTLRADQRLAVFLMDLARRYHARGYSSSEYVLRMTRDEIGSYLGLKLETVSRLLSRLHREGVIQVQGRVIKLLNPAALKTLVETST